MGRARAAPPARLGDGRAPASNRAARRALRGGEDPRADERRPRGRSSWRSPSAARAARPGPRRRGGCSAVSTRRGSGASSSRRASASPSRPDGAAPEAAGAASSPRRGTRALAELPADWSDLLCRLELDSSALLPRAALLCAPLNPTRDTAASGSRSAARAGRATASRRGWPAAASSAWTRKASRARVTVLRVLSDTDHVGHAGRRLVRRRQGPWRRGRASAPRRSHGRPHRAAMRVALDDERALAEHDVPGLRPDEADPGGPRGAGSARRALWRFERSRATTV